MKKKKIHIDKNIEQDFDTPMLSGIKKENPFQTPTSYFDELPQRIVEKVIHGDSNKNKFFILQFTRNQIVASSFGIAALILLMVFLFQPSTDNVEFENPLTLEHIFDEKPEWFDNMTDEELIETLYVLSDEELILEEKTLNFDNISDDEIYNYFFNESSTEILYNL